jgi:hypothetical protein
MLALPMILAPLVMYAVNLSKDYSVWLDRQHAAVKQGLAAAYAAGFTALAGLIGQPICKAAVETCDITGLDWKVILTWAGAMAIHAWKKGKR